MSQELIQEIRESDTPYDRIQKFNPQVLSDKELISLILPKAISNDSLVYASKLLKTSGGLEALTQCTIPCLSLIHI